MIEVNVNINNFDEFIQTVKPTKKSLEEQYRTAVDSWVRLTSRKGNIPNYGVKLERAIARMDKLREQIIMRSK